MDNLIMYLNSLSTKIHSNLKYFNNKFYCSSKNYTTKSINWMHETSFKNKIIHINQDAESDKESVKRPRGRVYWIDFGVNIGAEFNFPHFCVVIKEFHKTAIVIPLSSVKANDKTWKNPENLIINIGELIGLPEDTKEVYAMVNQIKTVSKQRLSDYKYNNKFYRIKLSNDQLNIIDQTILKLTNITISADK